VAGRIRPDAGALLHDGVRFRIASLTKPVVTVAALMLVDEGRLDLDAPVGRWLPALRGLCLPTAGCRPATAHGARPDAPHLGPGLPLRDGRRRGARTPGQAGLNPGAPGLDAAAFLARLAALPLVAAPGTAFRYGYSTDVLGCIVEQIEGEPLGAVLRRRLFNPLGMHHTSFEVQPDEPVPMAFADDAAWHAVVPGIGRRSRASRRWTRWRRPAEHAGRRGGLRAAAGPRGVCTVDAPAVRAAVCRAVAQPACRPGVDGPAGYCGSGFGFGLGLAVRHDWGPAAMPCSAGELTWSGISGTALFVQPRSRWLAVMFSSNMASRMVARLDFRRALCHDFHNHAAPRTPEASPCRPAPAACAPRRAGRRPPPSGPTGEAPARTGAPCATRRRPAR
jgi:CubicO group peptidase (beta-lactamase class C family)